MASIHDYTVEEVEWAIAHAMKDHNMPAVASLLCILAVKAPDHAQRIQEAIAARAAHFAAEEPQ